ncbi:MAG: YhfT family protein [Acholeplasma sp.]|nr:YhfT family protein [Acholeplasma sp.]
MEVLGYIVLGLIGGLAAFMANRGIAVFNDGFRPVFPEYFEKRIDRKALAATSFAMSFGLAIGFGITSTIGASIILVHAILLMTDIIGVWAPDTKTGAIVATVIGVLWAVLIKVGLEAIGNWFSSLPINIVSNLGSVSAAVVASFAIFPAIATGLQRGWKRGLINAGITLVAFVLITFINAKSWLVIGGKAIALNASGMALLAGVITMVVFAAKDKSIEKSSDNADLTEIFSDNIKRIRGNWYYFVVMGGLLALAASLKIMGGDPTSINLINGDDVGGAALAAFTRAIGFVPLVLTTAIVTGVYAPAGATFVFAVGLGFAATGMAPALAAILAFVGGAAVILLELISIRAIAKLFDKYPGIRLMGDHIRDSMSKVLEVALLVGSMIAANGMVPGGLGYMFIAGAVLLNKVGKKPLITPLAVGPTAVIVFGIIANILKVLTLI